MNVPLAQVSSVVIIHCKKAPPSRSYGSKCTRAASYQNHYCHAATCVHYKRASSGEGKFPYSKGGWVPKLPQEKNILTSYVSQHCHSIVATIRKPAHVLYIHLMWTLNTVINQSIYNTSKPIWILVPFMTALHLLLSSA